MEDEKEYCKSCPYWILWYKTTKEVPIYGCRLGEKPEVREGKLFCHWRK